MRINCYVCTRVAMRHLLCILSLAFLLLGGSQWSTEENMQRFRDNTGVSQLCTLLTDHTLSHPGFSCEPENDYSLGILTAGSLPSHITPSRTLKFNETSTIVQLLSTRAYRLPEYRRKILISDTNCLRYSHKYYLYTLAHILI